MPTEWTLALIGGVLIGSAASLMLLFNGRVTGISSIIQGAINPEKNDSAWRWFFLIGLFFGGLVLHVIKPDVFSGSLPTDNWTLVVAGLLVGFGTLLGSGCTSGHGVCGISRLSLRSLVATGVFILAGIIAVFVFRDLGVLP